MGQRSIPEVLSAISIPLGEQQGGGEVMAQLAVHAKQDGQYMMVPARQDGQLGDAAPRKKPLQSKHTCKQCRAWGGPCKHLISSLKRQNHVTNNILEVN